MHNKKNFVSSILLLSFGILIMSCEKKVDEAPATPVITKVTTTLKRDSSVNGSSLNEWIMIYGTHLAAVKEMNINGNVIDIKDYYANDTSISVRVPRIVPIETTNKIEVTTHGGKASYNFAVTIPPLKLDAMLNEHTIIGDTIVLLGQSFDIFGVTKEKGEVIFTGGAKGTIIYTSESGDTLKVKVPTGALQGKIIINGDPALGNAAKDTSNGWYKDNRNMMDITTSTTSTTAGTSAPFYPAFFVAGGDDPIPVGNYIRAKTTIASWKLAQVYYKANYNLGIPVGSMTADYSLKFEINTNNLNMDTIPLWFQFTLPAGVPGGPIAYNWKPFSVKPFNTGTKWQTVELPLSTMFPTVPQLPFNTFPVLKFGFYGAGAETINTTLCNFRIVPRT